MKNIIPSAIVEQKKFESWLNGLEIIRLIRIDVYDEPDLWTQSFGPNKKCNYYDDRNVDFRRHRNIHRISDKRKYATTTLLHDFCH